MKTFKRHLIGTLFYSVGFLLLFYVTAAMVWASEVIPIEDLPATTNTEFLAALAAAVGGYKALGGLGIAHTIAQLVVKFLKAPWGVDLASKLSSRSLFVVYFVVATTAHLLSLMHTSDLSFGAAITQAGVVSFIGAGVYKIYELYFEKKK